MIWVLAFGGIAVIGLAMVVGYAIWLAHKTADVASEVARLGSLASRLGVSLADIRPPGSQPNPAAGGPDIASGEWFEPGPRGRARATGTPSSFQSDGSPTT